MVYMDGCGELHCVITREEMLTAVKQWQDKPETKAMFAKIAAERKATVEKWVAQIVAQKKR